MTKDDDIFTVGNLSMAGLSAGAMSLARAISRIHGPVHFARESNGLHLYLADPETLVEKGVKELNARRTSINVDMYLGEGKFSRTGADTPEQKEINKKLYLKYRKAGKEIPCATCHRTGRRYMVSELLSMLPLEKRKGLIGLHYKKEIILGTDDRNLVWDENGNQVPEWVGKTTPLSQLPENHPAIQYLRKRGYDPLLLELQLEACYCYEAYPEDSSKGRWYKKLPGGMRTSPQGRIILSVRMDGSRWGYQSRLIDKTENGSYFVWGDDQQWHLIRYMDENGTLVEMFPPDEYYTNGFETPKYLNPKGCKRNKLLMGYDAAVAAMASRPREERFCVLCEGPLDAAKLGPPAIAILGKSFSDDQANSIAKHFDHVCTVMDRDAAGKQCLESIKSKLHPRGIHVFNVAVPEGVKDAGDLSYEDAGRLMKQCDPLTREECHKKQ